MVESFGTQPGPALELRGITKRFGSLTALDRAELTVRAGTVHALLGENGAGKTTLMRIAYGMLAPDAGTVVVGGLSRRFTSSADAIRAGVGMVHQHYALVPAMTVAENAALGGHGRLDAQAAAARVRAIAQAAGLALDPAALVADLSVEAQQRVEIVKALARDARVLILDEPTAVLAPQSAETVLAWLRRFAAEGGTAVLITHKLREALRVADDVTVLRHGRTVMTAPAQSTSEGELADAMLGTTPTPSGTGSRSFAAYYASPELGDASVRSKPQDHPTRDTGDPRIIAEALTLTDARGVVKIADASFVVRSGEIVGIAAVEGEGQHELLRALAGRHPVAGGRVTAPPTVGFIPEDRQRDALVLDFTLYENVALRGAGSRRGRIAWRSMRAWTRRLLTTYDVRPADDDAIAATLSGGNQQKLVLARELELPPADRKETRQSKRGPSSNWPQQGAAADTSSGEPAGSAALVAENPTRGLDIQAAAAVHTRLRQARDEGMAIVVYASDVDEVLALADRVLVVAHAQVRAVEHDRERVGRAMLGLM